MVTISLKASEADFKNYYDLVKKINALEAKESLTIEEQELLRFYTSSKYKQRIWLDAFYGFHPDDDAIEMPTFLHNADYTECEHNGTKYQFTLMQANAVKFMHEKYQTGVNRLEQKEILDHIKSSQLYLSQVFQKHKAWGKLIIKVQNNIYMLDI